MTHGGPESPRSPPGGPRGSAGEAGVKCAGAGKDLCRLRHRPPTGASGHQQGPDPSGLPPEVAPEPGELLERPSRPHTLEHGRTVDSAWSPAVPRLARPGGPEPQCADAGSPRPSAQGAAALPASAWGGGALPLRTDAGVTPRSPRRSQRRKREQSPVPPELPGGAAAPGTNGLRKGQPLCSPAPPPGSGPPIPPALWAHVCGDCQRRFRCRAHLTAHQRSHAGPPRSGSGPSAQGPSEMKAAAQSPRLPGWEATPRDLTDPCPLGRPQRALTRGSAPQLEGTRSPPPGIKLYVCEDCGHVFRKPFSLKRHKRTHLPAAAHSPRQGPAPAPPGP
ncbi:PREDICTED: basic salivary proline-rich protein 1-like [Condylura cristata]|uniref:basic salivary proline-rich protein 1-like n=1 Tax=Condylura cristata TaxID=143302 RepID=UPI000643A4AA|nr:PREDICTED: basic salivary proline-rich protein 1-like [Condylura cristata]